MKRTSFPILGCSLPILVLLVAIPWIAVGSDITNHTQDTWDLAHAFFRLITYADLHTMTGVAPRSPAPQPALAPLASGVTL